MYSILHYEESPDLRALLSSRWHIVKTVNMHERRTGSNVAKGKKVQKPLEDRACFEEDWWMGGSLACGRTIKAVPVMPSSPKKKVASSQGHTIILTSQQQPTALLFLLAGPALKTRDLRSECSWLDDSIGLGWSRLPFVDVPVVALELVLARKAIVAAVLAPEHGARILLFVRIDAMFGFVVAFEVTKVLSDDWAVLF